jgi:hypothetical protein
MINLIQNIAGADDGEQHKDNHINITKYFESNKDRILNLGEKNYENLVGALANDAIVTVASISSFNSISPLPWPSSTFLDPYNQSDTYTREQSEIFHNNSKGDIAE